MVVSIKNQAYRKLHSLSGLIEKAKGQSIFSSTDGDALTMFEGFIDFFKTYFEEIEDAVYVDFHETLAKRIVPLFSLINPQNTSDIPWSLIPAFERYRYSYYYPHSRLECAGWSDWGRCKAQ